MDLVDCTRSSPALAKKLAPLGTICQFPKQMSQVASTIPKFTRIDTEHAYLLVVVLTSDH